MSPKDEKNSPYDDDIDRFFSDVTSSLSGLTKTIVGHTYDISKDLWNELPNKEIDAYFNKPYQSRTGNDDDSTSESGPSCRSWTSSDPWGRFDRFWNRLEPSSFFDRFATSPFGLFAFSAPSERQYNTCVAKNGLSLWDSRGYWRCLFPNSEVPAKFLEQKEKRLQWGLLTKDEFETEASKAAPSADGAIDLGPLGVFFKQYNDLLDWKNKSFEAAKLERKKLQQAKFERAKLDTASSKEPVGSSSSSYTTMENDEVLEKETRTQYFSDGSSVTNTVTRKKPVGASEWATVEEQTKQGEGKQGWFWNK